MTRTLALGSAAVAALLALVLTGCSSLDEKPSSAVDLSGRWSINEAHSDDIHELVAAQRERRKAHLDRPQVDPNDPIARMGVHAPGDSPGGRAREREFRDRHDAEMNEWLWLDAPRLDIKQTDRDLAMATPDASARYVYGQKSVVSVPRGVADRLAGWEGRAFVVETRSPDGPSANQRYELSPNKLQLIVTTQTGGNGLHLTVRRVFDRASQ